ncbi:MAG: hypothetical protein CM1200mP41_14560 [Gammaproteobacteria bacterium]|nr:MAG: hypothetical protein CM1200mP41_14560 [Gammaproteobacteria bacterium]
MRDLDEDVGWLRRLGRYFGPLVPHILDQYHHPETDEVSIIARNMNSPASRTTPTPAGSFWHTDLSYKDQPSDAIFLYATHVPLQGGDTLVANLAAAYADFRSRLKGKSKPNRDPSIWLEYRGGYTQVNDAQERAHPELFIR